MLLGNMPAEIEVNILPLCALCIIHSGCTASVWLRGAGFRETKRVRLPGPANLMIEVK